MVLNYNSVRRSQIDQANGVAGLDSDGYLTNIGEIGHPPQINGDGAIEAIVSHRIDTLANLQALGALPEGEIVVVVNGSGVPIGFRVGDAAETAGGYPVEFTSERTTVTSVTLDSTSLIAVPGFSLVLPANSIMEVSGIVRFSVTSGLDYTFIWNNPSTCPLLYRDGGTNGQAISTIAMTGAGGFIAMPPTILTTTSSQTITLSYIKNSGASNKVLTEGHLMYKVIG